MTEVPLRFYGRRRGKPLSQRQHGQMTDDLPEFLPKEEDFKNVNVLEVGFGGGEHLVLRAIENPEKLFIGAEVFENGIVKLLRQIEEQDIKNIRIFPDDVRKIFPEIPDGRLDMLYLLFPDPWPKKRHIERRFINPENMKEIYRMLKTGGCLVVASDHPVYQEFMKEQLPPLKEYEMIPYTAPDEKSRYEAKGYREGREPLYMCLRKK